MTKITLCCFAENNTKKSESMRKSLAFTLAEVLITLGIIGVIAAITIPTLIANYQKTQYVTQLKKAYTLWNSVLKQVANDGGCPGDLVCAGIFDSDKTSTQTNQNLLSYFKVVKDCGSSFGDTCWPAKTYYNYDGTGGYDTMNDNAFYKFVTADGMSFALLTNNFNCANNWSLNKTGNLNAVCGKVYVDVNGAKPPNRYGRDTFLFEVTNGKGPLLYPFGGSDYDTAINGGHWDAESGGCGVNDSTAGFYCAGRILEEGWEMNY